QKVVDGEENPIAVIYFNKFYEVQKHLAITRHIYNNMIHAVSAAAGAGLPPGQQAIFREESTPAGELMRKLIADQEDDQIKRIEAAGMAVTRPDLAPFALLWDRPMSGSRLMPAPTTSRSSGRWRIRAAPAERHAEKN